MTPNEEARQLVQETIRSLRREGNIWHFDRKRYSVKNAIEDLQKALSLMEIANTEITSKHTSASP